MKILTGTGQFTRCLILNSSVSCLGQ